MKWNFCCPSITALLLVCSQPTFSKNLESNQLKSLVNSPSSWFITLGAGEQYSDWKNPMQINNGSDFPAPYNIDLYSTKNSNDAVLALSIGRRWTRDTMWLPAYSFGVFWQYFFRINLGNQIMQYSMPEFTNYKYQWQLTANVLLASAKFNLFQYGKFSPYFLGGIGSSFNRTSDYKETALPNVTPRVSPRFANFSTSEFAYHLGFGLDFQIMPQLIFSLGYNYQDLGQISSGPGKETWTNQSLNPGSYHSNELLFAVSYLFGK